ncbi:MAG: AIR synthase-related protein [Nitrospinales bacterium]
MIDAKIEITVREDVMGACEILGLDPMYVANEGRFAVFVKQEHADLVLDIMQSNQQEMQAKNIGAIDENLKEKVVLKTKLGIFRILDMLSGEQLSRIC